jgi:acetylornithine deacetylase/succinyl-diaminopimelate desuccinylase-like protein
MEAVGHFLAARRTDIGEALRRLIGTGNQPALTGPALLAALARPLAESGLVLHAPARPGQPLIACNGGASRPRLLLLLALDEPASDQPGGARAALVAALTALAALRAAGRPPELAVTLVCDQDRARGPVNLDDLGLPPLDVCIWDGGGYFGSQPWLTLGSHGVVRLRLRAAGPGGPIGLGAVVANPAWRLMWALAALKSADEEIAIPGFYDPVCTPEPAEQAALEALAPALTGALADQGQVPLHGLRGSGLALVQAFSPGLSITGLHVEARPGRLPTAAWAELTLTLVPEQTPAGVVGALVEHLEACGLSDIVVEVVAGYPGHRTAPDAPLAALVREIGPAALGVPPVLLPYGVRQAPLARLGGSHLAAIGIGPGHAPWPELEERVVRQAQLLAALLPRLSELPAD